MSAVKLVIAQPDGDPIEAEIVVNKGDAPVTVVISATDVKIDSATEPKVVT